MKFYSEYGEDKWINDNLQRVLSTCPKVAVDIGCASPRCYSNTIWLQDTGWRGLVVDGNPIYAPLWQNERWKFINAVISTGEKAKFYKHPNSVESRICDAGDETASITIGKLLDDNGIVDIGLLSIDIEGQEYNVLQTLDFGKYKPKIIISEYSTTCIGEDFRVKEMLVGSGIYSAVHQTVANIIYVINE